MLRGSVDGHRRACRHVKVKAQVRAIEAIAAAHASYFAGMRLHGCTTAVTLFYKHGRRRRMHEAASLPAAMLEKLVIMKSNIRLQWSIE